MPNKIITSISYAVLKEAKKLIKKDADNRYSLKEEWRIPVTYWFPESEFEYFRFENRCEDGWIIGSWIIVKPYESTKENNVCDGASFSPDKFKGIIPAAIFHDPWYLEFTKFIENWTSRGLKIKKLDQYGYITAFIDVTEKNVLKIGDMIFENIVRDLGGNPKIARAYYNGIRYGYPCFRILKPILERL